MNLKILLLILSFTGISGHALHSQTDNTEALRYEIVDQNKKSCRLIKPTTNIKGDLVIPDSITISNQKYGVTHIGSYAFVNLFQIRSVTFPQTLEVIEAGAFLNCTGLTEITLPASLTAIHNYAFAQCSNLWRFIVAEGNRHFSTDADFALFDKDKTILHYYPSNRNVVPLDTPYTLPESVLQIGSYAFFNNKGLTGIILPQGLKEIGDHAFSICRNLKGVDLPAGLESIGKYCFQFDSGITEIQIPATVKNIGEGVFKDCTSLREIRVTAGNKNYVSVGGNLYSADRAQFLAYPAASDPVRIKLDDRVKTIGAGAFSSASKLQLITLPENLSSIGPYAFSTCESLEKISVPGGVSKLPADCFWSCSALKEVILHPGLNYIGGTSFAFCISLTSLELPESVHQIMGTAFDNSGLKNLRVLNPVPPEWSAGLSEIFQPDGCMLYVPEESISEYLKSEGWSLFKEIKPIVTTGITEVSPNTGITVSRNQLILTGETSGKTLSIYSISGKCIYNKVLTANETSVSIPHSGIYLVKIDHKTFKARIGER